MIVSTLRLSSRDPNIQNWPSRKHKELRRQIAVLRDEMIRRYGKALLMVKFDYGQLEARVLAMASKDKLLCGSIIDHFDIHTHWLNVILDEFFPDYLDRLAEATGQTEETKIRKAGRDIIKSDLVFNALYGGGVDEISNLTSIPLETVIKIIARFWQNYKGVKDWHHERRNEYRDTGAIKTLTNRVRRGIMTGNEPINTPIQGTAADIVIEAMNEIAALARRNKDIFLHPRINIHDDLTFLVPEDELEDYIDVIHPILTKVRFPWQCVPLTAEVSIGDNWASMHPVYTFEGSYNR
jgi:DNA polymerase-1